MDNIDTESSLAEVQLPAIREELQIMPGSALLGGAPSWLVYDPIQSKFFQVSREVFELLSLWNVGTLQSLVKQASVSLGRIVTDQDVSHVIKFLLSNSLTTDSASGTYQDYFQQQQNSRRSLVSRVVHNYLFFRIPLVKPQRYLSKTYPNIAFLFTRTAGALILTLTLLGLYLVSRQWDAFTNQFQHLFSLSGVALYLVSLVAVKILHELGHAYTATHYGTRVSNMGIAFLVMMPVLYTDTTDAWRLRSSKKRAHIDAAGMLVELSIAGLATLLWAFLDDGPTRSAVFALATTSWALSLLVNLNPFMRFDGYYLIADLLGIQNLQPRSFALAKWHLRESLFRLDIAAPEPKHRFRSLMIGYGYAVWIYRFFLFIGIALLVYTLFFKVLGIILFVVEIAWFIAIPIYKETKVWWENKDKIMQTSRTYLTLSILAGFVALLVVPWSGAVDIPAIITAKQVNTLYPQQSGRIISLSLQPGTTVTTGDTLLELDSPELDHKIALVNKEIALLRAQQARRTVDQEDLDNSLVLARQLTTAQQTLVGLVQSRDNLRVTAPFSGAIADINPSLHQGQWINRDLAVGTIVNHGEHKVRGYIYGADLSRVIQGQKGVFIADNGSMETIAVELSSVAQANSLTIELPYLASMYGGEVATESTSKTGLESIESIYLAEFRVLDSELATPIVTKGSVHLDGKKESFISKIWRNISRVTVREIGT